MPRQQPDGAGTEENPYRIFNEFHLFWFAYQVNSGNTEICAVLMNDIDINPGYTFGSDGVIRNDNGDAVSADAVYHWTPIGREDRVYTGIFNGGDYTVRGMYIEIKQERSNIGFFGRTSNGCKILNLSVSGLIRIESSSAFIGGFIGRAEGVTEILNCTNYTHIYMTARAQNAGGFIGCVLGNNEVKIECCSNYGDMTTNTEFDCIGGITGYSNSGLNISYCANYGSIVTNTSYISFVGGISACIGVGSGAFRGLHNCFNSGILPNADRVGSLIGELASDAPTSNVKNNYYSSSPVGIRINNANGTMPEKCTLNQVYSGEVTWKLNGSDNKNLHMFYQDLSGNNYPTLDRTTERVFKNGSVYSNSLTDGEVEIRTADDLYKFAADVNSGNPHLNGKLMNDIDLNPGFIFNEYGTYSGNGSPREWTAIGEADAYPYRGIFDGNGYTISGLYFYNAYATSHKTGLFGSLHYCAQVKNVVLTNSFICHSGNIGGICGNNSGIIQNCSVNVFIKVGNSYGKYLGGICGYGDFYGVITNCTATGKITANGDGGGICGNVKQSKVENCVSAVMIKANSSLFGLGGICGQTSVGTIQNCYYKTDAVTDVNGVEQFGIGNTTAGQTTADIANITTGVAPDRFASGALTFELNGKGLPFKQTLGHDSIPVSVSTHESVYGYTDCLGTDLYTNDASLSGKTNYHTASRGITVDGSTHDIYCDTCKQYLSQGTPHTFDYVSSGDGTHVKTCSLCGYTASEACVADVNTDVVTPPCCTATGFTTHTCTHCAYVWVDTVTAITPHPNEYTSNNNGTHTGVCTVCGETATEDCVADESLDVITRPSCTATGYTTHTCKGCGYVWVDTVTETDPHSFGAWTVVKAMNCNVDGSEHRICSVCSFEETRVITAPDHNYVNGICTQIEGQTHYQSATLVENSNYASLGLTEKYVGYYAIENAGGLYWFAGLANGTLTDGTAQDKAANAVLTADITVNDGDLSTYNGTDANSYRSWEPIGNTSINSYCGIFDGAGHTISGVFYNNKMGQSVGLFGNLYGTVKNVGLCKSYIYGKKYVGGICGENYGTIENCFNTSTVKINDSFVYYYVGGICGENNEIIKNCYNTGSVSNRNDTGYDVCLGNNDTITNCYNPSGLADFDKFASGEVAYLLNEGVTNGTQMFYQTCGEGLPSFDKTKGTVYLTNGYDENGFGELNTYRNAVTSEYEAPVLRGTDTPDDASDDYYEIENAGQLYWFAALVNGTLTDGTPQNLSANAVLTADITVNEGDLSTYNYESNNYRVWTPIGSYRKIFAGTFDGRGHTVSGLYYNDTNRSYVGLSGYSTGTIKNTGICKSYLFGAGTIGAICGDNKGTVENCFNTSTIDGGASVGGICGDNYGTVKNCYNAGDVRRDQWDCHSIIGRNYREGTVENCYFLYDADADNEKEQTEGGGLFKTEESFMSGEVAYLLNNSVTDGTQMYYQTCGEKLPSFDRADGTVYYGYSAYDNGFATGEIGYTNIFGSSTGYQIPRLNDNVTPGNKADDYYEIANAGQLYWFASLVNGTLTDGTARNLNANAVLTADITVNAGDLSTCNGVSDNYRVWTPIGDYSSGFTGTFDGCGHTISGLYYYSDETINDGLFGCSNGTIKNTGISGSYIEGVQNIGGICGDNYGTIENCFNTSTISASSAVGGICGNNVGSIKNCYNTGTVNGNSWTCYNICGLNRETVENCYFLYNTAKSYEGNISEQSAGGGTVKKMDSFESGEVAYLLNSSVTDGTQMYYQTCGEGLPSFDKTKGTVYHGYTEYINGFATDKEGYTNSKSALSEYEMPTLMDNGTPDNTSDDYYAIENGGGLYWFAALVNGTLSDGTPRNNVANAVLTADITVNDDSLWANYGESGLDYLFRFWEPIGYYDETLSNFDYVFCGHFDGRGHTVSGLYYNDEYRNRVGLFGGSLGIIENTGVVNSYFNGDMYIGSICGENGGTIRNCFNTSTTVKGNYQAGTICGTAGTVINCYSTVTANGNYGISGDNQGTINNCYYPSDSTDFDKFMSGEVTYLLNGGKTDGTQVWYQTVGEGFPAFSGKTVYFDENTVPQYYNDPALAIFSFTAQDGYATVTGAKVALSGEVTIPETLGKYPVRAIAPSAFKAQTVITSLILPDSIETIGQSAFSGCTALVSVKMPSSLTSLGNYAFYNCSSLTGITIPDGVKTIGIYTFSGAAKLASVNLVTSLAKIDRYAFYGCRSLGEMTIPAAVKTIAQYAFNGCRSLTINTLYGSAAHVYALANKITVNAPAENCFTYTEVEGGIEITGLAYAMNGEISIPDTIDGKSVVSIAPSALKGQTGITSLILPDSIKTIGSSAFSGATKLVSVKMPSSLTSLGNYAFYNCSALTSITIPDGVKTIGIYTFSRCTSLSGVTLGAGVTKLDRYAFHYCLALGETEIPATVRTIGQNAFLGCSGLTINASYRSAAHVYALDNGITVNAPAENCFTYTEVDGGIEITGLAYAMSGEVTIPDTIDGNSVVSIAPSAFKGQTGITSLILPDSIKTIGQSAFSGCTALVSVDMPSALTSLGTYAFYKCSSLESIVIPDGVKTIGVYTFSRCGRLASVTLGSSLAKIDRYAFHCCYLLTAMTIPATVTIGQNAFLGCPFTPGKAA